MYIYIYIYIYNLHGISLARRAGLDPARFTEPPLRFRTWKLRMDTYGWVSIQPSQPKQAIFRTSFAFMSSSACPVANVPLDLMH